MLDEVCSGYVSAAVSVVVVAVLYLVCVGENKLSFLENKPRNNRNEPLFLKHIACNISELLNIDKALLADKTTKNFKKLFRV